MIDVIIQSPCSRNIRRITNDFVRRFEETYRVDHDLVVCVFNEDIIDLKLDGGRKVGYACYIAPVRSIFMASRPHSTLSVNNIHDWEKLYFAFLAHEFAHYEQDLLGLKVQERGVRVRSRTIMKNLGYEEIWA